MTFLKWLKARRILKYGATALPPTLAYTTSDMAACWQAATEQERERWQPLRVAAYELLDDVKNRYALDRDEELECEYMRALAAALAAIRQD